MQFPTPSDHHGSAYSTELINPVHNNAGSYAHQLPTATHTYQSTNFNQNLLSPSSFTATEGEVPAGQYLPRVDRPDCRDWHPSYPHQPQWHELDGLSTGESKELDDINNGFSVSIKKLGDMSFKATATRGALTSNVWYKYKSATATAQDQTGTQNRVTELRGTEKCVDTYGTRQNEWKWQDGQFHVTAIEMPKGDMKATTHREYTLGTDFLVRERSERQDTLAARIRRQQDQQAGSVPSGGSVVS